MYTLSVKCMNYNVMEIILCEEQHDTNFVNYVSFLCKDKDLYVLATSNNYLKFDLVKLLLRDCLSYRYLFSY